MKSAKGIVSALSAVIEETARELGYSIWDIDYVKEGTEYYLRITIEAEDGISIDDCEKMSRAIDPKLDEYDVIEDQYHLEVSSPGIEREIKTDMHMERCLGETVVLKLYAPIDGAKSYVGVFNAYDSDSVTVDQVQIPRKAIAKMNIYFQF